MSKILLFVSCLVIAALLGSFVTAVVCYKKWQETRWILENTYLQAAYPVKGHSLEYFTNLLEREINSKSAKKIEFLYVSSDLKYKMPITETNIEGTIFFAMHALEHTYGCSFELAESSVIVRQAPAK